MVDLRKNIVVYNIEYCFVVDSRVFARPFSDVFIIEAQLPPDLKNRVINECQ